MPVLYQFSSITDVCDFRNCESSWLKIKTHLYIHISFHSNKYEPRHAIMCLREINYVMRYDVVKSDVIISRRA